MRKFIIEIEEEDMLPIDPDDLHGEISLALTTGLKLEEDISFSIEEIY